MRWPVAAVAISKLVRRLGAIRAEGDARARHAYAQTAARLDAASRRLSGRLSAFACVGLAVLPFLPGLDNAPPVSAPSARAAARDTASVAAGGDNPAGRPAGSKPQGSLSDAIRASALPDRRTEQLQASVPSEVQIVPTRRLDISGQPLERTVETAGSNLQLAAAGALPLGNGLSPADVPLRQVRKAETDDASLKAADKAGKADSAAASGAAAQVTPGSRGSRTAGEAEQPAGKTDDDKPLPVPPAVAPTQEQPDAWSEADIADARQQCAKLITGLPLEGDEAAPVRNGACGTPAPITLRKAGAARTELAPAALVNCRMAVALNGWIDDVLQPASREAFGQPVVRILTASSYVCRNRYGAAQAPISEHAFANAVDISGFVLGDGRVVRVLDGWGPSARDAATAPAAAEASPAKGSDKNAKSGGEADKKPASRADSGDKPSKTEKKRKGAAEAASLELPLPTTAAPKFLRKLHAGACAAFGTVLGPDANEAHRDHLHFDLKQRRSVHVCD